MTDPMGPYLVPSLIIGLGAWGGAVAEAAEAALRERSPALARACRALALPGDAPDMAELLRAHLRVSRMAEMIRALEQEGLMRLDPVVAPSTHVYIVADQAEWPSLTRAAALLDEAAAELKAKVVKVALVAGGGGGGRLPFPVYVLEPVTAHGLVLSEEEFQAAVTEMLVAVAQPGGSQVLAGGRTTGTLGIAWLTWSPAALREAWAGRLAREALARCVAAAAPGAGAGVGRVGLPDLAAGREAELLPPPTPIRQRNLKRTAAVVDRRLARWTARLEQAATARAATEAHRLTQAEAAALTAGPDGLGRLRSLLEGVARDAARRLDDQPPRPARTPPLRPLRQALAAAEALPDPSSAAMALGAGIAIFTLIWWLIGGRALSWLGGTSFQLVAYGAYCLWRRWRIAQGRHALESAIQARTEAAVSAAYHEAAGRLDQALEARAQASLAQLNRLTMQAGAPERPPEADRSALSFPLVETSAAEPLYQELRQHLPDLGARLAAAGVLQHWQDPVHMAEVAEVEIRQALAELAPLDPARAATRAYGDRLATRLRDLADHLSEWAQPLLARPLRLPEGQRWLFWPAGLPCPPLPPEVTVIPYAQSCIAMIQVVTGLPDMHETGTA